MRGSLKFEEEKMLKKKQSSSHLRKNGHRFHCILYYFIHPNPITKAQYSSSLGTGALFLISLSLSGEGAQLLLISFATRLHGFCTGSNNGMEDGGTYSSPKAL